MKELIWLENHGYTRDDPGFNRPTNTALAVSIDILPLPGIGHFYLGYVGDGLKFMLLSWLVYPFIVAPVDAYRKSSYRNDTAFLEYAHEKGWFNHPEGPNGKPLPPDDPRANDRLPTPDQQQPVQATQPAQPARTTPSTSSQVDDRPSGTTDPRPGFCSNCGSKVEGNFCKACGTKRTSTGSVEAQTKCSNCGELRPTNAEVCPHCGLK
jgi:hypothetical protein